MNEMEIVSVPLFRSVSGLDFTDGAMERSSSEKLLVSSASTACLCGTSGKGC